MNNKSMDKSVNDIIKQLNVILADDITDLKQTMANNIGTDVDLINDIYNYIASHSGKLIRPILTILSAKLFNYNGNNHIKLGAAIELIHTATLLHDDVIDESTMRRNYSTVNIVWSNKAAILMGDYLFSKAFQLMVETNNLQVLDILSYSSAVISKGEIKQLENIGNLSLTTEVYLEIISAKTAYLFKAATEVGALIAGASSEQVTVMANVGYNLGLAFQIIDDVNDYLAAEVKTGKNVGDDLQESKITLPLILALRSCNNSEQTILTNIIKQEHKSAEDISVVIELFNKYNCLDEARITARSYLKQAVNLLQDIPNSTIKTELISLINAVA